MPISEGERTGVVGQVGYILVAIGDDGREEVLLALTGEGAEEGIKRAAKEAMLEHARLEVRSGLAPTSATSRQRETATTSGADS